MAYKLGSLFDGSGGFPLAGGLCGIEPVWAAEIEPYPIAVTKSHFPNMRHLGDISKINGAEIEPVDIITFGSPCQDLSVAGKRAGLKHEANGDEETTRSGLFMEAVRIIKEMREATNGMYPRFALWENVPGAFSSNKGEDFRIVCEELIKIVEPSASMPPVPQNGWNYADSYFGDGWSLAYRVFDAQYWGVPQRRRRIHLIADFRGQSAREVLFEREGVRGYFAEGRTPWQAAPRDAQDGSGAADREGAGEGGAGGRGLDAVAYTLKIRSGVAVDSYGKAAGKGALIQEDKSATLACGNDQYLFQPMAYSFDSLASNSMKSSNPHSGCRETQVAKTLDTTDPNPCKNQGGIAIVEPKTFILDNIGGQAEYGKASEVNGTLRAGAQGAIAYVVGNHPADSRVDIDESGKVQTLTARMDTGGGNVPMVMEPTVYSKGTRPHNAEEAQKWEEGKVANTLNTFDQGEARANELVVEPTPVYCLQGSLIDRAGSAAQNGGGIREDVSYTLTTIDHPAIAYGTDVGFLNSAENQSPTLLARQYKDPHLVSYPGEVYYIVRRLTPTECARLQGFPDRWGDIPHKDAFTDEEYDFWLNVRNTHATINGKSVKTYTKAQMLKWYNKLHSDGSEYKMWGNGIALPPAIYCMQGIADELRTEQEAHTVTYDSFLRSKIEIAPVSGFDVSLNDIHPALKPHQKTAVQWALHGGRRALFESFGLGKTVQELEFCRQVLRHEGGAALIIMPLGVRQEFSQDAVNILGMEPPRYITSMADIGGDGVYMTNYERVRDGDIEPVAFSCCVLDEAAVLRSFGSKTYQTFLPKFKGVRYKLVATATPAPNRLKELIHYAGFLEVMDTGQALTRFFQRDSTKANNLTLYPHKVEEFWLWVSSWALYISKPSDLGFDDTGYDLPPMDIRPHMLSEGYGHAMERDGQMKLLNDAAASLQEASREKKESIQIRCAFAKELVDADPEANFILWHDREEERHELKRIMPETVDIYGSMDYDERERRVTDFSFGKTRLFATKKSLSGCGCNFQRFCHRAIFVGIDYEFHDFIQAVHRIYRFLQMERVIIDIIYTESEEPIYRSLMEKWAQYNEQQEAMRQIIAKYGLSGDSQIERMARTIGVDTVEITGKRFRAIHGDCVEETRKMEENSVDLIVTSIPFSNHYEYTPSYNDFGHNENTTRFFQQMGYLSPELLRILKPGRVFACHVKDRVLFGNATGTGMPTMEPFHALCIQHYMEAGFQYFGMITVVTDVVRENNQTYRLGWTEQCKDGTKMGVGCPEYILLFRKLPTDTSKAYADTRVEKTKEEYTRAQWQIDAHGFWRSSGDRLLTKAELLKCPVDRLQAAYRKFSRSSVYSYEDHVDIAKKLDEDGHLPATFMVVAPGSWSEDVWDDVNRMRTLNTTQSQRRQQLHVCPLQFDIVDRLINRYSNAGELVFDPFGGIGTVPLRALKLGRCGLMTELNGDYFRDAVGYLDAEEEKAEQPSLFDMMGI